MPVDDSLAGDVGFAGPDELGAEAGFESEVESSDAGEEAAESGIHAASLMVSGLDSHTNLWLGS